MKKRPKQIYIDKFDYIAKKTRCSYLFEEDCYKWEFIRKINTIRKAEKLTFDYVCEVLIKEVKSAFLQFKKIFSDVDNG